MTNMTDPEFTRLLRKTVKAAAKHHDLVHRCDREFEARFGHSPSDLDCDQIIDLMYHGQDNPKITAKEAREHMTEAMRQKGLW